MANISSIANEMAKSFITASDKKYILNKIMYDLNYLVYSETNQLLDYKTKSELFLFIFNVIAGREKLQLKEGEELTPDFTDIVILFERRNFILEYLKAGIRRQEKFN